MGPVLWNRTGGGASVCGGVVSPFEATQRVGGREWQATPPPSPSPPPQAWRGGGGPAASPPSPPSPRRGPRGARRGHVTHTITVSVTRAHLHSQPARCDDVLVLLVWCGAGLQSFVVCGGGVLAAHAWGQGVRAHPRRDTGGCGAMEWGAAAAIPQGQECGGRAAAESAVSGRDGGGVCGPG